MDLVHREDNRGLLLALLKGCLGFADGPPVNGIGEGLLDPFLHILDSVG